MIACDVAILKWFKRYITTNDITPRKPADQVTKKKNKTTTFKVNDVVRSAETAPVKTGSIVSESERTLPFSPHRLLSPINLPTFSSRHSSSIFGR